MAAMQNDPHLSTPRMGRCVLDTPGNRRCEVFLWLRFRVLLRPETGSRCRVRGETQERRHEPSAVNLGTLPGCLVGGAKGHLSFCSSCSGDTKPQGARVLGGISADTRDGGSLFEIRFPLSGTLT